ncbi:MAG: peptide deformylase [Christensenellales bacterium]
MIKEIIIDKNLIQKSEKATQQDLYIIKDLVDTAKSLDNCLSLSANQIGYNKTIIIVKKLDNYISLINPVITKRNGNLVTFVEKCYSCKEKKTQRHNKIEVLYYDNNMKIHKQIFNGYMAMVVQHCIEHFQGIKD